MNVVKVVAILIVLAGTLGLVYGGFSYIKKTHQASLGSIELSVNEKTTISIPVWASIWAIIIGGGLLFFGFKKPGKI